MRVKDITKQTNQQLLETPNSEYTQLAKNKYLINKYLKVLESLNQSNKYK